jgi:type II secretory pathway pseudopilin PulG
MKCNPTTPRADAARGTGAPAGCRPAGAPACGSGALARDPRGRGHEGHRRGRRCHGQGGFTLAEVLAALLFMAIVIPVAVEGVRIASRAGQVGARRAVATRIGDSVLNEQVVRSQSQTSAQNGTVQEAGVDYQWRTHSENWSVDQLTLLTVQVDFPVQGQTYNVLLSTLIDPNAATATASTPTTP